MPPAKMIHKKSRYTRRIKDIKILRRRTAAAVEMNPTPDNMRRFAAEIAGEIRATSKSFTPAINDKLRLLTTAPRSHFIGCGLRTALAKTAANSSIMIQIGTASNGDHICVDADSAKGQVFLLKNFASSENIMCDSLIMPAQRHANCWFNCMFTTFFVSDKGRKFMRFFRQLMIEGKTLSGAVVRPKTLRNALLLLNLAIEACYGGPAGHDVAINTNNIIAAVYRSIPRKYPGIKNIDAHGNPYYFYIDLLTYLNAGEKDAPKMVSYKYEDSVSAFFKGILSEKKPADVIVIQLTDTGAEERANASDFTNKPLTVTSKQGITYVLDSVVVRDTSGSHFCACIHCDGMEYTYDGAVTSQLVKDDWSKRYNSPKSWGIEGSQLKWNFTDSYMLAIYYRVN
jgi:hypothetical protein